MVCNESYDLTSFMQNALDLLNGRFMSGEVQRESAFQGETHRPMKKPTVCQAVSRDGFFKTAINDANQYVLLA